MGRYQALKLFLVAFLGMYFAIGIAASTVLKSFLVHDEIYPVFSWFLFDKVPKERNVFGLRLHQVGEAEISPPLLFQEAEIWVSNPHSITAQTLIQRLGRARLGHSREDVVSIRRMLEKGFLPPDTRYELVRIRYHPLKRWRTGEMQIESLQMYGAELP